MHVLAKKGIGGDVGADELVITGKEHSLTALDRGQLLCERDGQEGLARAGRHAIAQEHRDIAHDRIDRVIQDLDLLGIGADTTLPLLGEGIDHELWMMLKELPEFLVIPKKGRGPVAHVMKERPDVGVDLGIGDLLVTDPIHGDHGIEDYRGLHGMLEEHALFPYHDGPLGNHKGKRRLATKGRAGGTKGLGVESDKLKVLLDDLLLGLAMDLFSDSVLGLFLGLFLLTFFHLDRSWRRETRGDFGPVFFEDILPKEIHVIEIP